MPSFSDPDTAIPRYSERCCRHAAENRLPLTRAGLNYGPVIRRAADLFGPTVNIAARIAALASPGQLLATQPIAEAAGTRGIRVRDLGTVALRPAAGKSLSI
nr:adenylate/guanylate cyclase domain-containing protein [Rhizobium leguminosarum]